MSVAFRVFNWIDGNEEAAETAYSEDGREPHQYVIGHYDGPTYKVWEMVYTDLAIVEGPDRILCRHASAEDGQVITVETLHNAGITKAGYNAHRVRAIQFKSENNPGSPLAALIDF